MIEIQKAPTAFLMQYQNYIKISPNKCFENCGSMTLFQHGDNDYSRYCKKIELTVSYCLGFLTDCYGEVHPHAWLKLESKNKAFFCDPTLQVNSRTWNQRRRDFKYQIRRTFEISELIDFFRKNYADRSFNEYGVPLGECQFPIINLAEEVLCVTNGKRL